MVLLTRGCTTTQPDNRYKKESTEALILHCLPVMTRFVHHYRHRLKHTEMEDLVSEAMLTIVEHAGEAQEKEHPVGWLVTLGRYRMMDYITTRDTLIPHHHYHRHYTVLSLDVPQHEDTNTTLGDTLACPAAPSQDQEEKDYAVLYEALHRLSPTRRQFIAQRFGLDGFPETRVKEMAATRREQQRISKALAGAKHTLASLLSSRHAAQLVP